jgi:threonine/homoserine/homoserine lactone efflux protein
VALAAQLGRLGARPALRRVLNGLGGLVFIALAVRILRARPGAA